MENRYDGEEEPDTSATASETITARDGPVEATVTIETEAPNVEAAGVLAEALAAANRSIVHRVFSDEQPEEPLETEGDQEDDGRIMDMPEGAK